MNLKHTVRYKNIDYPIKRYADNHYLISLYHVANIFSVNSKLVNEIIDTYSLFFVKDLHHVLIDEKLYLTRVGIIRMAMLVKTVEAVDFASYLERELVVFQNSYEQMKKNYNDVFGMK